jgi:glucose-1-phosphate cytidylyltransferase
MHNNTSEPWRVTLLDTGLNTMTGARVKKAKPYVKDETFMLTYGDGLADININEALKFHKQHGKLMTMTSAKPDSRFGLLNVDVNNKILQFKEKPQDKDSRVTAGDFICQPEVFDYIDDGEDVVFEQEPIKNLVKDEQIYTYKHNGFWMPMDTLRDKIKLNELYKTQNAPWMVWKD